MAITALYRLRSGEVLKISIRGQAFAERDPAIFGVVTDPVLPDGTAVRPTNPDGTLGPLRVLGFAKHYIGVGQDIRNATQGEIDTYAAAEAQDEKVLDAARVAHLFETHPQWRKAFTALVRRIVDVTNDEKAQINALRQALLDATSLADLKARVTDTTEVLPTPTVEQALAALKADISPED
jgi:hypothetical protein